MTDKILKMTIYWHLKYSCLTLVFMSEEEKEKECRKIIETISNDLELWEALKSYIGKGENSEDKVGSFDFKFSMKGSKIFFVEKAILMGIRDANYLMSIQEEEKEKIPLLTKFS